MSFSDWLRSRKVLIAVFGLTAALGFAVIVLSPRGSTSTTLELIVAIDIVLVTVLWFRPEWIPNVEE